MSSFLRMFCEAFGSGGIFKPAANKEKMNMKKWMMGLAAIAAMTVVAGSVNAATLFSQDFASGGTTATYVSATPGTGQWNAISTSGAAKAWTIASNNLNLSSTGGNSAFTSRTADFATTPAAVQVSFSFTLASSSTALTSAVEMELGSGFGTANSTEIGANTYAKFGLNLTASNGFVVRDISGTTNGATTFGTSTNTFTWVLNNSGSSMTYLAPDGSSETIANDTWDLWVGTSKQLNDRAVTTASQSITDWKFGATGNGTYAFAYDDFAIVDLVDIAAAPEPSIYALVGAGLVSLLALRRRKATVLA
jgi:hypothetical protein